MGDEGLTGAMDVQMLSRKAQVKSLMIFNVVMLSVLFVHLQDRYFSKIALWQKASFYEGDEGLKGVMDRYFSKIALWQKASSYEEDEGLKGVIEIQRLLQKIQVKSFMVLYVAMIFYVACFFCRL